MKQCLTDQTLLICCLKKEGVMRMQSICLSTGTGSNFNARLLMYNCYHCFAIFFKKTQHNTHQLFFLVPQLIKEIFLEELPDSS